jgi:hypothetical protein
MSRIGDLVKSATTGLTAKILALTGAIAAIFGLADAIQSGINKTESWTCGTKISFPWCHAPGPAETWSDEVGGPGGAVFSPITCGPDELLVGVHGKTGDGPFIFSIGPVCATFRVDWKHQITSISQARRKGDEIGSNQGDPFEFTCPSNMVAIGAELDSAVINTNFGPHEYLVVPLNLRCSSVLSSDNPTWTTVIGAGKRLTHASRKPFTCPRGSAAFGIKGRAGQFVDAASLGCRRV